MYLPQLATSCKKLLIMIFHRKGDRTHYLGGSRGGVVGAGAAWGQPGGRDGADDSTGGFTDRARTLRCAAARAGPARTTTRRGGGRPRDGGLGRTSRAATVERRPGTHARLGKKEAAHAGERAGGVGRRRFEFGEGAGVICWGMARLVPTGITSWH